MAFPTDPPSPDDPLLNFVPVPHVAPRSNSITPALQREFIAHLAATGIVKQAALQIGKSLEAIYKLRQRPGAEGFRAAWDAAIDRGVSRLEDCALARAIEGDTRHIVSGGEVVAKEQRHDERLVMFFLRARLPQRYDRGANIGPGHPVYERVMRDYAEHQRKLASSPEAIARVRASLDAKIEEMRLMVEADVAAREADGGKD
ncbi:MAG: hypothetical protein ABJH26_01060 [Marinomonas sp.]